VGSEDPVRNRRKLNNDLRLAQLERTAHPEDPQAAFAVGWSCFCLGRLPEALRLLRSALGAGFSARKLYSALAQTLAQLGEQEQALQVCDQGLIEFPDDPELLYHRGVIQIDLDDLIGASQTLAKLVNLPPQRYIHVAVEDGLQGAKGRCVLGRIYLSQRRVAEAEVQFRTAIRHQPRSAQAWLGLGQMYVDAGLLEGYRHAVAELRQCPGGATLLPALNAHRLSGLIPGVTASRSR
jgi:tetratricopeptide (TPR) repeat protein